MNCEVQHLDKNIRYRILIINGEQYILDMERSFWKIIFPFLFWLTPSPVFKVEDQVIVEQLKEEKKEKLESSWAMSLIGVSYVLGLLLVPLMNYFEVPLPLFVNIILLVFSLILVALLYYFISQNRQKKLYDIVKLEILQKSTICIRPSSSKQVFKLIVSYLFLIVFNIFLLVGYIETHNIMLLFGLSGFTFLLLLTNRVTIEEGYTTMRFKDYEKVI
ncbi:DUF443 family protein [Oceanobacillus kimchii]|uniref:DUF443 family protein n=1 Tax=Oceanobacillus kimchii TaxID=746691 RepID=UPI0009852B8D|nr:DUF443 family protein [Oceanobacillus kimchii]